MVQHLARATIQQLQLQRLYDTKTAFRVMAVGRYSCSLSQHVHYDITEHAYVTGQTRGSPADRMFAGVHKLIRHTAHHSIFPSRVASQGV
jgi:hypothetical protein